MEMSHFSNSFIAISAPLDFFAAKCKQVDVCIVADDFFEISNLPWSPSKNIPLKIVNDVLFYSLQSALASVFTP